MALHGQLGYCAALSDYAHSRHCTRSPSLAQVAAVGGEQESTFGSAPMTGKGQMSKTWRFREPLFITRRKRPCNRRAELIQATRNHGFHVYDFMSGSWWVQQSLSPGSASLSCQFPSGTRWHWGLGSRCFAPLVFGFCRVSQHRSGIVSRPGQPNWALQCF